MKKALISPIQLIYDYNEPPNLLGDAVAQVADEEFPIVAPFFWVDCDDSIVAYQFYWKDSVFYPVPPKPSVSSFFSPSPIFLGQETTLTWSATDATEIRLGSFGGQSFSVSGSQVYTPVGVGTFTETITAINQYGFTSKIISVKVVATQAELDTTSSTVGNGPSVI